MNSIKIQFKQLHMDSILPEYQTSQAAGMDLYANLHVDGDDNLSYVYINPGERKLIKTGIAIALPDGYEGQIRPRSGLALKQGISVANSPGTIDSDYRGDLGIILINHGNISFRVNHHDRIAQLVICPIMRADFVEVEEFEEETGRNSDGFGTTGI